MPLYEYKCTQCQRRVEKIESYSAPERRVCEACGGEMERQISSPAIQFKGTGWYVTDYANKSSAPPAKSESDSKPAAEAKPAAASDAKPAAPKPAAKAD